MVDVERVKSAAAKVESLYKQSNGVEDRCRDIKKLGEDIPSSFHTNCNGTVRSFYTAVQELKAALGA